MLALAKPELGERAQQYVMDCINTGWISSQGQYVRDFERAFADYVGANYAIATSSGTTALHLALATAGIGPKDEVLVPSFTFIATANAVTYCGAKPVFCDVDPETWCIDVEDAKRRMTGRTKAAIPVHINGYPAEVEAFRNMGLVVVEDACQALGSTYGPNGSQKKLGTLGQYGCFSFFANKLLTTGEGGMLVTDNHVTATLARRLRDHGRSDKTHYVHDVVGFNYRMTNLQAAVGLSQIEELERRTHERRRQYHLMCERIGHSQASHLGQAPWMYHYKTPTPRVADALINALMESRIEAKPFYRPCHLQAPYWRPDADVLPVCESLHGIVLPVHAGVGLNEMGDIEEVIGWEMGSGGG